MRVSNQCYSCLDITMVLVNQLIMYPAEAQITGNKGRTNLGAYNRRW
jgi:hypothetical protein